MQIKPPIVKVSRVFLSTFFIEPWDSSWFERSVRKFMIWWSFTHINFLFLHGNVNLQKASTGWWFSSGWFDTATGRKVGSMNALYLIRHEKTFKWPCDIKQDTGKIMRIFYANQYFFRRSGWFNLKCLWMFSSKPSFFGAPESKSCFIIWPWETTFS